MAALPAIFSSFRGSLRHGSRCLCIPPASLNLRSGVHIPYRKTWTTVSAYRVAVIVAHNRPKRSRRSYLLRLGRRGGNWSLGTKPLHVSVRSQITDQFQDLGGVRVLLCCALCPTTLASSPLPTCTHLLRENEPGGAGRGVHWLTRGKFPAEALLFAGNPHYLFFCRRLARIRLPIREGTIEGKVSGKTPWN